MPIAKTKSGRNSQRAGLPEDARRLIELIIGEVQAPADMQRLLDSFPPTTSCATEAAGFLKAKDRAQRREAFLKTEPLWFNKYGWFMARIVGLFGLIVFASSFFLRGMGIDYITAFIMGAAGYYALLVTLSNWRYRAKNRKRQALLNKEAERYQKEIVQIASSLLERFQVDPTRYPVLNPKSRAGLELKDGGYYIPVARQI